MALNTIEFSYLIFKWPKTYTYAIHGHQKAVKFQGPIYSSKIWPFLW